MDDKITVKVKGSIGTPVEECNSSTNVNVGAGPHKLGDHADVLLTAPTGGQVLVFNGTDWVNGTIIANSITQEQIDKWDGYEQEIQDINDELDALLLTVLPANYHKQGGNSYGATFVLGSNDDYGIEFRTNGVARTYITNTGNLDHHGDLWRHYHVGGLAHGSTVQEMTADGTLRWKIMNQGGWSAYLKNTTVEAGNINIGTPGAGVHTAIGMTFVRANRFDIRVIAGKVDMGYIDDEQFIAASNEYSNGFDLIRGAGSGLSRFAFGHLGTSGNAFARVHTRGLSSTINTYSTYTTNTNGINTSYVRDDGQMYALSLTTPSLSATSFTLPTFTPGSVLFAGAGGVISQDNANLFWDDTNNRWGLGINTPAARIHINSVTASAPLFEISRSDTLKGLRFVNYTGAGSFNLEYSNNLSAWSTFASFNIILGGGSPALGLGIAVPTRTFHQVGNGLISNATYTAKSDNDFGWNYTGTLTPRATASDTLNGVLINPTLVAAANDQSLVALNINPTFNVGAFTGTFIRGINSFINQDLSYYNTLLNSNNGTSARSIFQVYTNGNKGFEVVVNSSTYVGTGYVTANNIIQRSTNTGDYIIGVDNNSAIAASRLKLVVGNGLGSTEVMTLFRGKFVHIGSTAVPSATLQVTGNGTSNLSNAFLVQNSTPNDLFRIADDGTTVFSFVGGAQYLIFQPASTGLPTIDFSPPSSGSLTTFMRLTSGTLSTATAGNIFAITATPGFTPTSGTANFNVLNIQPNINQTGGANGITRGIHINPTLTPAADFRAIETSNNTGYAFYSVGTAKSYHVGLLGIGSGITAPTSMVDISGVTAYQQFRLRLSYTPSATADANGAQGDFAWGDDYLYIKTSAGWKRTALSTF